jgi:multicomponent Na+:H+ antiporter subunit E
MIVALYAAAIVAMWVLAWGSLTFANVVGGLAVAAVLVIVTPGGLGRHGRTPPFRPLAVGRFLGFVLVEMVRSNVSLARDVLAPRSRLHPGVMAVALPRCSDGLLTLITNVLALTPGTNPVHVEPDPTVLYVHVLHMHDVDASRAQVLHLADLAFRAFSPNPQAVSTMDGAGS